LNANDFKIKSTVFVVFVIFGVRIMRSGKQMRPDFTTKNTEDTKNGV